MKVICVVFLLEDVQKFSGVCYHDPKIELLANRILNFNSGASIENQFKEIDLWGIFNSFSSYNSVNLISLTVLIASIISKIRKPSWIMPIQG